MTALQTLTCSPTVRHMPEDDHSHLPMPAAPVASVPSTFFQSTGAAAAVAATVGGLEKTRICLYGWLKEKRTEKRAEVADERGDWPSAYGFA